MRINQSVHRARHISRLKGHEKAPTTMKHTLRPEGSIWQRGEGMVLGGGLAHMHGLMRTGVGGGTVCQGQQGASRGAEAPRQAGN